MAQPQQPTDSIKKDVLDALGEYTEGALPVWFANKLRGSDTAEGIIGIVFDLYSAVPNMAGPVITFLGQRLKNKGGASAVLGEFLETIPTTSRALRAISGKTEQSARADLVAHWQKFKINPKIGAPIMSTTSSAPSSPPAPPPQDILTILNDLPENKRRVATRLYQICIQEARMDLIPEAEGEASKLIAAIFEGARRAFGAFQNVLNDSDEVMIFINRMSAAERRGLKDSANEKEWNDAAKGLFRHNLEAANFLLLGFEERHPDSPLVAKVKDLLDRLNLFAGGKPTERFEAAKRAKNLATFLGKASLGLIGFCVLYLTGFVICCLTYPEHLGCFSWGSFFIMFGGSAITMIAGAFAEKAALVQVVNLFLVTLVWPALLTIVFTGAMIFGLLNGGVWSVTLMAPILPICWDLIGLSIVQKIMNTVGAIPVAVAALSGGVTEAESEVIGKQLRENGFLVKISATVAGVAAVTWLLAINIMMFVQPVFFPVAIVIDVAAVMLGVGYGRRQIAMRKETDYHKDYWPTIKAQDILVLGRLFKAMWVAPVIGIILIGIFFLVGDDSMKSWWMHLGEAGSGIDRAIVVSGQAGSRVLNAADELVKKPIPPTVTTAAKQPTEKACYGHTLQEARVQLEALNKSFGGDFCNGGKMGGYPCDCFK